jgi:hypothetical protein
MSETLEQAFCRIASEVVREQNLASLERSMHPDLFRFIHYAQEKMKALDHTRSRTAYSAAQPGRGSHEAAAVPGLQSPQPNTTRICEPEVQ